MKTPPAHSIIQYTGFYHGAPALGQDQNTQLAGTFANNRFGEKLNNQIL